MAKPQLYLQVLGAGRLVDCAVTACVGIDGVVLARTVESAVTAGV